MHKGRAFKVQRGQMQRLGGMRRGKGEKRKGKEEGAIRVRSGSGKRNPNERGLTGSSENELQEWFDQALLLYLLCPSSCVRFFLGTTSSLPASGHQGNNLPYSVQDGKGFLQPWATTLSLLSSGLPPNHCCEQLLCLPCLSCPHPRRSPPFSLRCSESWQQHR